MNRKQTLAATAAWIVAALYAPAAMAAGTLAGTTLTTNSTLSFQVGGITQPSVTAQYTRLVDQVVNMSVDVVTSQPVTVSPQQANVMTTLRVKNLSNAPISFSPFMLEYDAPANGFPANFYRIYRDANGNGLFDAGTDELIGQNGVDGNDPYINAPLSQPEATETWFAFADIPIAAASLNGQTVNYGVLAAAQEFDTTLQSLKWVANSGSENPEQMDTYLADGAGPDDSVSDGYLSVSLNFLISAANLSVTRINKVVSDLVNGTGNPKAIPGALVEYCVAVSNAAGAATASDVVITDTVSPNLTIDTSSVRLNGTVSGSVCNADGVSGGSVNGSQVSGTIQTLNGGETKTVIYRATVN